MKSTLSFFTLLLCVATLSAQTSQGQSVLSINGGFSLAGALFGLANLDDQVDASAPPALQLTYDHAVNNRISLGGGLSYQRFKLAYSDYGEDNEDFDLRVSRFNVGLRGLVHYGSNEELDMYSGVRVGLSNWSFTGGPDDPEFDPPKTAGVTFAPQLILFGLRGYITEQLGFNGELGIGAPHVFTMGLSYRF